MRVVCGVSAPRLPFSALLVQIHFLFLISRQGKVRLTKWYDALPAAEKTRVVREVSTLVLNRPPRNCNVIEWRDKKLVYKRCVNASSFPHYCAPDALFC